MMFESIKECANKDIKHVGGKAKWIGKLSEIEGINIPMGICVGCDCFQSFIDGHALSERIHSLMDECIQTPITTRKNLSMIREIIINSKLDIEFINNIILELKLVDVVLTDGVVVRSSSQCEDGHQKSYAGVFTSTTDIKNVDDLEKAILTTWASQFSEISYIYDLESVNSSMALVIQKMIYADSYGVAFSKSPNNERCMLIEEGKTVSQIVDGYGANNSYLVDRLTHSIIDYQAEDVSEKFKELIEKIVVLEKKFDMYCDIEWAMSGDELYFLQCRPQTKCNNNFLYKLISNDNVDECEKTFLGPCEKYLNKFIGKQYLFRKAVLESGFHVFMQYFLVVNDKRKLEDAVNECKQLFAKSKFVIVEFGDREKTRTCKIEDLFDVLAEAFKEQTVLYCRIGELVSAEKSGYTSINTNKECLVEYTNGRMTGIQDGRKESIKVIISKGITNYLFTPNITCVDTIDDATGEKKCISRFIDETEYPYLSESEVEGIEVFTKRLSEIFRNANFEWLISNGCIYGKDISVETNLLSYNANEKNVISKGYAKGKVFFLKNLKTMDTLSEKYDISLYAHSKGDYEICENIEIKKIIDKLVSMDKPIIFAERPTNGILAFSDYISGCVFQQGSILSHIGICMRERNIPAYIDKDVFDVVREGKTIVELVDGSVRLCDE